MKRKKALFLRSYNFLKIKFYFLQSSPNLNDIVDKIYIRLTSLDISLQDNRKKVKDDHRVVKSKQSIKGMKRTDIE